MYTLEFSHEVYFDTQGRVTIYDLTTSLAAFERVIQLSEPALISLFPDFEFDEALLFIDDIRAGSLRDKLTQQFCFKNEKNLQQTVKFFRKYSGVDMVSKVNPVLGCVYAGALLMGAGIMIGHVSGCQREPVERAMANFQNINFTNNGTIILDGKDILGALHDSVKNKQHLATNSAKVLRVAKGSEGSSVTIDGQQNTKIGFDIISQIPAVENETTQAEWVDKTNVSIRVRALDLDSTKTGWKVIVPSIGDHRLPMKLADSIDRNRLLNAEDHQADISLKVKYLPNGDKTFSEVMLLRLID